MWTFSLEENDAWNPNRLALTVPLLVSVAKHPESVCKKVQEDSRNSRHRIAGWWKLLSTGHVLVCLVGGYVAER